jgi:hypothetical protein
VVEVFSILPHLIVAMEVPKQALNSIDEMEIHEKVAFDEVIRPADSYTEDGTYWADLPVGQRINFVVTKDGEEARREFAWLWDMFKADPLAPIAHYFRTAVLPGAGLGLEGWVFA